MTHIFVKKEFKTTSHSVANRKNVTIICQADIGPVVGELNNALQGLKIGKKEMTEKFVQSGSLYTFAMNHDIQKYLEEIIFCIMFDIFARHGFNFVYQYDQNLSSVKAFGGSSVTSREVFIFRQG